MPSLLNSTSKQVFPKSIISYLFSHFLKIFLIWTIFKKSLLNLLQYPICFMLCPFFFFFWLQGCGILAPQLEIKPAPTVLKGLVPTTGPPEKS